MISCTPVSVQRYRPQLQVCFGARFDRTEINDPVRGGPMELVHTTTFMRRPDVYHRLAQFCTEPPFDKGDVTLHWYAASFGHEPYSIAMFLEQQLDSTGRNFRLLAKDINPSVVDEAKAGHLELSPEDFQKYRSQLGSRTDLTAYFAPTSRAGHYQATERMSRLVTFQAGDIRLDAKNRIWGDKPVIVGFRNAWYLLTPKERAALAKDLAEGLPQGSLVVVGGIQADYEGALLLQRYGMQPVGGLYGSKSEVGMPAFFRQVNSPTDTPTPNGLLQRAVKKFKQIIPSLRKTQ